jgi:branched-subunit amino acid transport protein
VLELALLVLACAAATYAWRGLGMLAAGRVRVGSNFFAWAGCVAYALIAGLAVRIILLPSGTLASTPLPERLLACAIALVAYFAFRRNLFIGIATGFVALVGLIAIRA